MPPPGKTGKICVLGPAVFGGYDRKDNVNAEACRDGWPQTGVLRYPVTWEFLFFTGRWSDMFILGYSQIFPFGIAEHPAVAGALRSGNARRDMGGLRGRSRNQCRRANARCERSGHPPQGSPRGRQGSTGHPLRRRDTQIRIPENREGNGARVPRGMHIGMMHVVSHPGQPLSEARVAVPHCETCSIAAPARFVELGMIVDWKDGASFLHMQCTRRVDEDGVLTRNTPSLNPAELALTGEAAAIPVRT